MTTEEMEDGMTDRLKEEREKRELDKIATNDEKMTYSGS